MRGLEDYQLLGWDPYNKPMHQKPHKPEDSKVIEQVAVTWTSSLPKLRRIIARALELCRLWNAMLLLDEADVFLGARANESIEGNELVSIFLTKLEYYQGILFLTTNRIASIDHAFQSRVDMFLPYHDLTSDARRQVWDNFIDRAGRDRFEVNEQSLKKLSTLNLNGREIKNLIKSAQLLGLKAGGKVSMDRLYMLAEKRKEALSMQDFDAK